MFDHEATSCRFAGVTTDLLASVVDHVRDAVCVTTANLDEGHYIVHVNPAFTELTGYSLEEVLHRPPNLLYGPATDQAPIARVRESLRTGSSTEMELMTYRRDGSELLVRIHAVPIRDRHGHVTHYVGLLRDAMLERAAEVSGRIFLAALHNTTDAMVLLDAGGLITYVNPAMLSLSGRTAAELLGRGVRSTGITPRRLRIYREIITTLKTQSEWRGEYESSARNGEPRRLEVSVTRVDTPESRMRFVVSARDVTHQRRLEYIAEATNLVENMGYVFASLRHELANPINSIKTALTVLRQNHAHLTLDRIDDYLDRVLLETGRVEYLLRSMRSFNTTNRPALEPLPVGAFLDRFTAMVQKDVRGRGVTLEVVKDERAGAVLADPQALHQVMLNLITNALDALEDRPSPRIRVEARRGVSHVRLIVSDNGRGVPVQMRERVFQAFHTTKPKGTGLGLAITRKLVTLMRGTIELDSTEGAGARFTITLDAADAPEAERRTPTLWPPAAAGDTHVRGPR